MIVLLLITGLVLYSMMEERFGTAVMLIFIAGLVLQAGGFP